MKINELTGAALDWAVAKIEFPDPDYEDADRFVYVHGDDEFHFTPSTNWAQGGPIIESNLITIFRHDEEWFAHSQLSTPEDFHGDTPLVAAMRCYVASKMGDTIDIPEGVATDDALSNEQQGETA
jgi:hypothetical protein